jgi:membrane fusion protein, heavy metal efflux system
MSPARSLILRTLRAAGYSSILAVAPLLCAGCGRLSLPGGGKTELEAKEEPKTLAVTLAARTLELFMEHPYLVQGEGAKFNVHLTVLKDGMPVRSGTLTVVAKGPSGKTTTVAQPAPKSPGIYGPVVAFPEAGENEMVLSLKSDQAEETIRIPVMVYADAAAAKKAADADEGAEPEGKITFLKEQQWKIGLVAEPVARRRLVARLRVPGQIVPQAGAKAVVTPPIAGRVLPPPQGRFPRVGETTKAGEIVAVIEPPLAGPPGVQLVANRAQVQALETELIVKQLGVEVEIKTAKIELEHARHVFERARSLSVAGDAISKREFEEAQHRLRVAEADYEGKLQLRKPYEQARMELHALANPDTPAPGSGTSPWSGPSSPPPSMPMTLLAPLSGTVTAAQATEGEFVESNKALFTIINLDRVWIEAQVSEFDLERVTKAPAADFTLAAYPGRRFTILGRGGGKLIDVGSVVDPGSRTVPVRYEIENPDRLLKAGMFLEVGIETARAEDTLAIPESAIVDEDGRPTAYVELEGEAFQKQDLELGLRDSGFVQVKQGLKEGERVVTKGAYAIRLASVSAVIPAHGHAH